MILSNSMKELIPHSVAKLGAPFHAAYTAEEAQAYKPRMQAFEYMFDQLGCGPEDVLHCSSSFRYDLMTAHDLRITNKVYGSTAATSRPTPITATTRSRTSAACRACSACKEASPADLAIPTGRRDPAPDRGRGPEASSTRATARSTPRLYARGRPMFTKDRLRDPALLRFQAFIAGEWRDADAGGSLAVTDPATGETIGHGAGLRWRRDPRGDRGRRGAFPAWRRTSPAERAPRSWSAGTP